MGSDVTLTWTDLVKYLFHYFSEAPKGTGQKKDPIGQLSGLTETPESDMGRGQQISLPSRCKV